MTKQALVKRFVKGPKPIWHRNKDGNSVCVNIGEEIMLPPNTAHSKRRYLHTPEEHKAHLASKAAGLQASQDEKDARNAEPEPESDDKGGDS